MTTTKTQTATFGGGCFWGVEAIFSQLDGVIAAASGYEGGTLANPNYQQIRSGNTGHAEVVEVIFDPRLISYQQLLEVFFTNHNPTQLNQQGDDIGTQYRSAIFYHDQSQQQAAGAMIENLKQAKSFGIKAIVTSIVPASTFYRAAEYHQDYLAKNGLSSCHI